LWQEVSNLATTFQAGLAYPPGPTTELDLFYADTDLQSILRSLPPEAERLNPENDHHAARLSSPEMIRSLGWIASTLEGKPDTPEDYLAAASSKSCPVTLFSVEDEPVVFGHRVPRLTTGQFNVVKVLIDAFPDRVPLDALATRSDTGDPVGMIDRRRRHNARWRAVLDKPGQAHGGYGLRTTPRKPRRKTE
jgi:hypothetical protein